MKILITGGNGYVASRLHNVLKLKHDVVCLTRNNFDLTNNRFVNHFFNFKKFDVVLHCAVSGGSRLKQDTIDVIDNNLQMYYNLLSNRHAYKKLISFGSGAELNKLTEPYGLSKHIIRQSILKKENFYNIRIFAVFDEYELNTRFIKANIKKYINKESLIIHQNKYMDFFNMLDLISIVEYVMLNDDAPKEIDCTYSKSNTLFEIAEMINNLDEHKVSIKVENPTLDVPYVGKYTPLGIEYIGLESSIKNTYNILKNEY